MTFLQNLHDTFVPFIAFAKGENLEVTLLFISWVVPALLLWLNDLQGKQHGSTAGNKFN